MGGLRIFAKSISLKRYFKPFICTYVKQNLTMSISRPLCKFYGTCHSDRLFLSKLPLSPNKEQFKQLSMVLRDVLFHRPHIVTVQWLLDSFTHGTLLPEDGYFHPSFLPPAPAAVDLPAAQKAAPRASRPSAAPPPAPSPARQARAEEDLLSQYMENDQTVGELINSSSLLCLLLSVFLILL